MIKYKKCPQCGKLKSLKEFYYVTDKANGYSYCKPCSAERSHKWYIKNKKLYNERSTEHYKATRNQCIELLGGKCQKCGTLDSRVFCIDHEDGRGFAERKASRGTGMFYKILRKIQTGVHNYQILCLNCNWIKALEKGELNKHHEQI